MTTWLFDLGNTRLKCAPLHDDGGIGEVAAVACDADDHWLDALPSGDVACLASVAPEPCTTALLAALATRYSRLHRVRTEPELGRLKIAYAVPSHLGVDRFLAMLGLCGDEPLLVVGVGTALTIDLVDAQGHHRGGRIAPSPRLMRESLHARAPHLPLTGGHYVDFADDTDHALVSGCEGAALALIESSLRYATERLGVSPILCLHGGGAEALRSRLPAHRWTPDAVLAGLARWHALRLA